MLLKPAEVTKAEVVNGRSDHNSIESIFQGQNIQHNHLLLRLTQSIKSDRAQSDIMYEK